MRLLQAGGVEALHRRLLALQVEPVGVLAIERARQEAEHLARGVIVAGVDLLQLLLAGARDLVGWKRRPDQGVGQQIQAALEVARRKLSAQPIRVPAGLRREAPRHRVGEAGDLLAERRALPSVWVRESSWCTPLFAGVSWSRPPGWTVRIATSGTPVSC